jgi:ribonuclease BN (tRNA processing enzyme)
MKIKVLGCSGAIAKDCRTTSFLVDDDVLIDAGTGVGDLTLDEMQRIGHVFITHSHLDHIAALPLMIDAVASRLRQPIVAHALPGTLAALRQHVFNDTIWPDFTQLPRPEAPFLRLEAIEIGQVLNIKGKRIEVLPAEHTVPACGFAVSSASGGENAPHWVFSGDTERNPAFWRRINQLNVGALVIETAFSNRERELAHISRHLSPEVLADELDHIHPSKNFPIYITHTKPSETALIMQELAHFDQTQATRHEVSHDIRWLEHGQVMAL